MAQDMRKDVTDPGYQAFRILQFAFVVAPLVAGLDKFFYFLTNWSQYLSPLALRMFNNADRPLMIVIGIVEVIAGIGVIFKPRLFAYIISLWLFVIIINLLTMGQYFDIVLRDVGLLLAAFSLGKLSQKYKP